MNLLILGPQGSGKGTQSKLICDKFNLFWFEAGLFLREIASSNKRVSDILLKGNLVPQPEMASAVASYFDAKGIYDQILFDGFPRTVEQYKIFKNWLEDKKVRFDLVLVINIGEEETLKRLALRGREDDDLAVIKKRLSLYNDLTVPLIYELRKEIKVVEINGERSIAAIFEDIVTHIQKLDKHE